MTQVLCFGDPGVIMTYYCHVMSVLCVQQLSRGSTLFCRPRIENDVDRLHCHQVDVLFVTMGGIDMGCVPLRLKIDDDI